MTENLKSYGLKILRSSILLIVSGLFIFVLISSYNKLNHADSVDEIDESLLLNYYPWFQTLKQNLDQDLNLDSMSLTPHTILRSLVNIGDSVQLSRQLFEKFRSKKQLNIYIIGGSLSVGGGVDDEACHFPCLYSEYLQRWFHRVLPIKVNVLNAAMGATNSEYYAYCFKEHVNIFDADIIIGELAINDRLSFNHPGYEASLGRPLEELVRQIISLENDTTLINKTPPYLILVQMVDSKLLLKVDGSQKEDICNPHFDTQEWRGLCAYYNITCISLLQAICEKMKYGEIGFEVKNVLGFDQFHSSALSHRRLGYLIVSFFKMVLRDILRSGTINQKPFSSQNSSTSKILPDKLYHATWLNEPTCWTFPKTAAFISYNYSHQLQLANTPIGFTYFEESNQERRFKEIKVREHRKDVLRGYIGSKAGSTITLQLKVPKPTRFKTPRHWLKFAISAISCNHCLNDSVLSAWVGTANNIQSEISYIHLSTKPFGNVVRVLRGLRMDIAGTINITLRLEKDYELKFHAIMTAWDLREY